MIPSTSEILRDAAQEFLNLAASFENKAKKSRHPLSDHEHELIRVACGRLLKVRCTDLQVMHTLNQRADVAEVLSDITELLER